MASPGLTYYLPEPVKNHSVLHIPGSHTLYVGPLSCTRRHSIHSSLYGDRKNVSFLYITEADVISGHYEDLMIDSIGTLIETLEPSPHIFFLAVFCIDDFLGTDENAMLAKLSELYPDRQFAIEHIDPVSLNEEVNMGMRKHTNMYKFVKVSDYHDKGINFLGNFASLDKDCEFFSLLKKWGYGPVRELFTCKTYEDYQDMGKSSLCVVLRYMGVNSADYFKNILGVPYCYFNATYDAERNAKHYNEIANLLGQPAENFSKEIEECRKDAEETVKLLNGMPVAIDCSASLTPFRTANSLLNYGFNVKYIFRSNSVFKFDAEDEELINKNHPEIIVTRAESYTHLCDDMSDSECIAIGLDGARVLRSSHFVDVWHDEGFFGFHGIHKLMDAIRNSYLKVTDWSNMPELKVKKGAKK